MPAHAYAGIDVAVADGKRLPVCVCRWSGRRLVALPLKTSWPESGLPDRLLPPALPGNERILDASVRTALARELVEYLRAVEEREGVRIVRIGIDAPRQPRPADVSLRACEVELKARGIKYYETPDQETFDQIPDQVAEYLEGRTIRKGLPRANQIWMLFGFELFETLSAAGWECLEVYPQATVRRLGAGDRHKKKEGGALSQLKAAAAYTGWPDPVSMDPLRSAAFGSADDCLDAYLAAWVAALDEADREPLGNPPADAIWIPRVSPRSVDVSSRTRGKQLWPLTQRFDEALLYATHLHEGTFRKDTLIPYVSHLLAVCARVLEDGGTEKEAIAALLHDSVEDAGGRDRFIAIRRRFGKGVAAIVAGCSDTDENPKPPWRERKERYIAHLRHEANRSTLRVSLADKLHNARAVLRDYRELGEALWQRFNAPAGEQLWYYEQLVEVYRDRAPGPMADELGEVVAQIRARHGRVS